jgi:hypothetical protein
MWRLLFLLILAVALSSCLKRSDTLAPIVTITSPRSGTVQVAGRQSVSGYALDDEGIKAIRILGDNGGPDLIQSPYYANEAGKKLVQFWFEMDASREGQRRVQIEVEDINGLMNVYPYTLEIDASAPVLSDIVIENASGGQVRVSGFAQDNNFLQRISVNDEDLSFVAAKEKRFSINVPSSSSYTIVAEDQAGNLTSVAR